VSETPTLAEVVGVFDRLYPRALAESWDSVGLMCGDPARPVSKVIFAVDPVDTVVDEALAYGADLLVTHHPLYLRGTSTVAADTAKGRVVHRLIEGGCALFNAHTNADHATPGVSDALGRALGLVDLEPVSALPAEPVDKLTVFVPHADAQALIDALASAGAGSIGAYERCAYTSEGAGTFRPLGGAHPAIGEVGRIEVVEETRVEMVLPRRLRAAVLRALLAAHPYEEPAFDLIETAALPGPTGSGRIGRLERPVPLREFAAQVASALPPTAVGVRAAGDPERVIERVAVCGGAGDFLLEAVAAGGADAYVTADLRHHRAAEALEDAALRGGPALLDATHWATEHPWLAEAAALLVAGLGAGGDNVGTRISMTCTDPWSIQAPSARSPR
jgi:dinuclear metal center YbgI/SA1388 family protein